MNRPGSASAAKQWSSIASQQAEEPLKKYDVGGLLLKLAEATRFKFEGEKKDPAKVPEYRRPKVLMPELDNVTGQETVSINPDFYDKAITEAELFRSYCQRRKETALERKKSKASRPKADEEDTSLTVLLAGLKGREPDVEPANEVLPAHEAPPVAPQALQRPSPSVFPPPAREPPVLHERVDSPRPSHVLDASFADTESDW